MYLYQTTFTMTVQATVFVFLSKEQNTVRTSLLKEKLFSTVTNYVQRNTSLYQCEARYPHIRLLRDPVLWTGFSFAYYFYLRGTFGPPSGLPNKFKLFGRTDVVWQGRVWHIMRNECMTPSMRNKILCETTLYDAGNIPYEGKNCIRVWRRSGGCMT